MKSKRRVANDQAWQKRTDEWVQMNHESSKRKEAERERRRKEGRGYVKVR